MAFFNFKKSLPIEKIQKLEKELQTVTGELSEIRKSSSAYLSDYYSISKTEGYNPKIDFDILLAIYKRESWVRAAIDVIRRETLANGFSINYTEQAQPHQKELENNPFVKNTHRLFTYPNPDEIMDEIAGDVVVDLEIYGVAYVEIVKNQFGIPVELYNMYAPSMRVKCDEFGKITGFVQITPKKTGKGTYTEWGPKDVLFFRLPNPGNEIYGLSPLESLALPIEADVWAQLYNINFFKNDATPRGHLDLGNCSRAQIDRMREYWKTTMQGATNSHKTIITEGGAKYSAVGVAPKDMEFLNQRKFSRDEIIAVLGVPPSKVGIYETANRSNSNSQEKFFKAGTILPLQTLIESKINRMLLPQLQVSEYLKFEFRPPDLEEAGAQAEIDSIYLQNSVITINEVRARQGKSSVPWGDKPIIKATEVPLDVGATGINV